MNIKKILLILILLLFSLLCIFAAITIVLIFVCGPFVLGMALDSPYANEWSLEYLGLQLFLVTLLISSSLILIFASRFFNFLLDKIITK